MTRRVTHRTTTLHGGPLHGCTARVYPDVGQNSGHEPATLTLCLGAALPDWRPAGWVTYHRQADGTYHWTNTEQATA